VRSLLALTLAAVVLAASAGAALAAPPDGDWTLVRKDGYVHYACKSRGKVAGRWVIRTATWVNGHARDAYTDHIGVYAAVARRSNKNLVDEADSRAWRRGYVFMTLRGAVDGDRLWLQAAAYGPARPWSNGFRIRRITRCNVA
jgi:opacity protein-like surface antigen